MKRLRVVLTTQLLNVPRVWTKLSATAWRPVPGCEEAHESSCCTGETGCCSPGVYSALGSRTSWWKQVLAAAFSCLCLVKFTGVEDVKPDVVQPQNLIADTLWRLW